MEIPNKMKNASNLVNICVDELDGNEMRGRLFHCFSEKEKPFDTIVAAFAQMEKLYDSIRYPQAMVHSRKFVEEELTPRMEKRKLIRPIEEVRSQTGQMATFLVVVHSRQNASWQGEIYNVEHGELGAFSSDMELLNFLLKNIF